jgi:hypothetical protein
MVYKMNMPIVLALIGITGSFLTASLNKFKSHNRQPANNKGSKGENANEHFLGGLEKGGKLQAFRL